MRPRPRLPRRVATVAVAIALLGSAVSIACSDGDPLAPTAGFGTFRGRWDGREWRGQGYALLQADTLYLVGHRPDPRYHYDETVAITVAFGGARSYALQTSDARLSQIVGGDAGHFLGATGELRVTHYDAARGRMRGTVRLAAAERGLAWRFELGAFDVPIYTDRADVPRDPRR